MNGLENIISSYLGMKKMIRYTSDRKYANVIKDLNRKYNERFSILIIEMLQVMMLLIKYGFLMRIL